MWAETSTTLEMAGEEGDEGERATRAAARRELKRGVCLVCQSCYRQDKDTTTRRASTKANLCPVGVNLTMHLTTTDKLPTL